MKLWDKHRETNDMVHAFTTGKDRELDHLLAWADLVGSMAHARMLGSVGLISPQEANLLEKELKALYRQAMDGKLTIDPQCEDIHSHIEMVLTGKLGDTGKRIHTGRSRNDQVILAIRLFARKELRDVSNEMQELFFLLIQLANKFRNHLMPGYSHMQVAMPSSFGMWFSAYAESLADDLLPLRTAYQMMNQNPLGTGAGYGSSFPLNREMTTRLLGFATMNINSVYAQMSRVKAEAATSFALASVASTLARLANDICLYMGSNYGFFSIPGKLTTGSSIMPHKKNPDVFELIRARCNRLQGLPAQIASLTANLPTGYHRDFQLIKESFLPAFKELKDCISMISFMIREIRVSGTIKSDPVYDYMFSVEALNRLTQLGIPFRDAYDQIAQSIEDGSFKPDKNLSHTHTGSLGKLGLASISKKWKSNLRSINFDLAENAIQKILHD